jgi:hypothetical protein
MIIVDLGNRISLRELGIGGRLDENKFASTPAARKLDSPGVLIYSQNVVIQAALSDAIRDNCGNSSSATR